MLTGVYVPGTSLLHRASPGAKLLLLALFLLPITLVRTFPVLLGGALLVVALYLVAGLGLRVLWEEVRPMRWFVVLLVPYQWWALGWRLMVLMVGALLVSVAAAGLVTRTTRVAAMLSALERAAGPLRHVGVDPARVALTFSLTLRAVPVIRGFLEETTQARKARGLERSVQALVTPTVVRTIRHAERVGDALAARGLDD